MATTKKIPFSEDIGCFGHGNTMFHKTPKVRHNVSFNCLKRPATSNERQSTRSTLLREHRFCTRNKMSSDHFLGIPIISKDDKPSHNCRELREVGSSA